MVLRSKDYHNEVIITSLQGVIKRPLEDNTCRFIDFYGAIELPPSATNIDFPCFGPYLYSESLSGH